jgi:peptidylprolyl isomerase|tara:strand:- start:42 stop:488 length:447 start_codon:yes stop_codon:yes gene_type:complete
MTTVDNNQTLTLHYKGTLQDGTVFDNSHERGEPMTIVLGEGRLIPGFEDNVRNLNLGETKTFTIPADEAYGQPNPEARTVMNKEVFPTDFEFGVGTEVPLTDPNGNLVVGKVLETDGTTVTVDLNHPLAGQDLTFEVEIVSGDDEDTT